MSINRGMESEDVVHKHNRTLLRNKKEQKNTICSNMDEPESVQVVLVLNSPPPNAEGIDSGLIPGLGRSPGGGHGNPLQYF